MHVANEKHRKLNPKLEKMIFVGNSLEQKGYKCFNPSSRQTRISRNVLFDEAALWYVLVAIYVENKEPSEATNPSSEYDWISVPTNADQKESPRSLELAGPEPSISRNTVWNEAKMLCRQCSQ